MKCLICQAYAKETTELKNGKKFYHCQNCFFTGLYPEFFPDMVQEKQRYDQHQNSLENKGYVDYLQKFINYAVKPYAPKSILDYGSGPEPVLAKLLTKEKFTVEIYDPFYAANILDGKIFEMITLTEVIEHFHNPIQELSKIVSLLKPEGYLSIMTRFTPQVDQFKSWYYKDDLSHVSFFNLTCFEYIVKELGFKILKNDTIEIIVLQKLGL